MPDYLVITSDKEKKAEIGRKLVDDVNRIRELYTPLMMEKMYEAIDHYRPGLSMEDKDRLLYMSIYDYWVYGATIDEDFYLHLFEKNDSEIREYMVRNIRGIYVGHMNSEAGEDKVEQLEDKYRLYKRLKKYYLRDVIEVSSMEDMDIFAGFVQKHKEFVVKPADYSFGIGVHKASMSDYDNDINKALESILDEGKKIQERHPSRMSKIVIEELICQDESLAELHPDSVNAIRATAVRTNDGTIHLFHPWIKVGFGGTFVASAALDGFDAEIDPDTGVVITDGYQEMGNVFKVHPDSGIKIKGFQIPKWKEMVSFVNEIMNEMPKFGYIGWDLVLTPKGWCVMEGNYSGEFTFQLINGRGYKKEFEELIGWKFDKDFWWQESKTFRNL